MLDDLPLFGALPTDLPPAVRIERATPPGVIFWRQLRDAAIKVARAERAHGCMPAVRLLARDALRSHRRMQAAQREAAAR
jgi:hypothetical protein